MASLTTPADPAEREEIAALIGALSAGDGGVATAGLE